MKISGGSYSSFAKPAVSIIFNKSPVIMQGCIAKELEVVTGVLIKIVSGVGKAIGCAKTLARIGNCRS